jgi:hypothetical protein
VRQAFDKNMIYRQRPGTLHDVPAEQNGPEQVLVLRRSEGLPGQGQHQHQQR